MTKDEAINLTATLKGLMPRITDEQARIIGAELLYADYLHSQAAVREYARTKADFVLAEFLSRIGRPGLTQAQRTAAELSRQHKERRALRERWAKEDELIGAMSDEQLEQERTRALAGLSQVLAPGVCEMLGKRDPRKSRAVKGMIFDCVGGFI